MNKVYKIPCTFEMYGTLYIEAESKEEAIEKAYSEKVGLPAEKYYIDESFNVDEDNVEVVEDTTV